MTSVRVQDVCAGQIRLAAHAHGGRPAAVIAVTPGFLGHSSVVCHPVVFSDAFRGSQEDGQGPPTP